MELQQQFEQAEADVNNLSSRPSNDILLQLYSLHKQTMVGDVNIDPPSNPFDIVGKAKYQAWAQQKGKAKEDCMKEYIALVQQLKG